MNVSGSKGSVQREKEVVRGPLLVQPLSASTSNTTALPLRLQKEEIDGGDLGAGLTRGIRLAWSLFDGHERTLGRRCFILIDPCRDRSAAAERFYSPRLSIFGGFICTGVSFTYRR